jgi:FKBP-type peptidyl-prolyl cis-trans isomerase
VDEKVGTGTAVVKTGDLLEVRYTGRLRDGTIFDSNKTSATPLRLRIGGRLQSDPPDVISVIQGWNEGLIGMKVGGERRLIIPPALAYGVNGTNGIPPNSELVFDVALLKIN